MYRLDCREGRLQILHALGEATYPSPAAAHTCLRW